LTPTKIGALRGCRQAATTLLGSQLGYTRPGRFANEAIRKGTVNIEYKGQSTSWNETMSRPDSDLDDFTHTFLFELDDGRVVDARVKGNAARWVNHSCDPNCTPFEGEEGRIFIEAK
jgi:SET domain-containing protein